ASSSVLGRNGGVWKSGVDRVAAATEPRSIRVGQKSAFLGGVDLCPEWIGLCSFGAGIRELRNKFATGPSRYHFEPDSRSGREWFALEKARGKRMDDIQRGAATHIHVCHFCAVPPDDRHWSGHVTGRIGRRAGISEGFRRLPVFAHGSLSRNESSDCVRHRSRRHGMPGRILEPDTTDDHWPRIQGIYEQIRYTPEIPHERSGCSGRRNGIGSSGCSCEAVWLGATGSWRFVWSRRDSDVCGASCVAESSAAGARVYPRSDLDEFSRD